MAAPGLRLAAALADAERSLRDCESTGLCCFFTQLAQTKKNGGHPVS